MRATVLKMFMLKLIFLPPFNKSYYNTNAHVCQENISATLRFWQNQSINQSIIIIIIIINNIIIIIININSYLDNKV